MVNAVNNTDFDSFQLVCRHCRSAFVYRDDHTRMGMVCVRPDRIPAGHSWGKCDETHCPYFGIRIDGRNVTLYDCQGAKLGECGSVKAAVVLEPEDYE